MPPYARFQGWGQIFNEAKQGESMGHLQKLSFVTAKQTGIQLQFLKGAGQPVPLCSFKNCS